MTNESENNGTPATPTETNAAGSVGSSVWLAELEAERRRLFHEWWDTESGSKEEDEAGLRYEAIRERWESERGHSANESSSAAELGWKGHS